LRARGTRALIDAVFGPTSTGETTYTPRLLRSLHTGMILQADRNFGAATLLTQIAATGADLLVHLKSGSIHGVPPITFWATCHLHLRVSSTDGPG
jgi:hypothetical protein